MSQGNVLIIRLNLIFNENTWALMQLPLAAYFSFCYIVNYVHEQNHYYDHWTCFCMRHPSTYTQSIGLYKGFGGLTDIDKLINLQFIYRVCGILLAWISRPEVNGPPQLGLLAGSLAETLILHDQYTGYRSWIIVESNFLRLTVIKLAVYIKRFGCWNYARFRRLLLVCSGSSTVLKWYWWALLY